MSHRITHLLLGCLVAAALTTTSSVKAQGAAEDVAPTETEPKSVTSEEGVSDEAAPEEAAPEEAAPEEAAPEEAAPEEAAPEEAAPEEAAPEEAAPEEAAPEEAAPEEAATEESATRIALDETGDLEQLSLVDLLEVDLSVASKKKESLEAAPAIVQVISRAELDSWGYQNLSEVLQHVAGFNVVDDHIVPNVGVRGMAGGPFGETNNIKVLVDGNPVTFRTTGGHWIGDELIPVSSIEQIEIVRGPASAIYGANAFLGAINIITRSGALLDGGTVRFGGGATGGQLDLATVDAASGLRLGAIEVSMGVRLHQEDRNGLQLPSSSPSPTIPSYNESNTTAAGRDDNSQVVHGRLTYHFTDDTRVALSSIYSRFDRRGEFASWSQLSTGLDSNGRSAGTRVALENGQAGLEFSSELTEDINLRTASLLFWGNSLASDRIEVASDVVYIERDIGFVGTEQRIEADWQIADPLAVSAGFEFVFDQENVPRGTSILKDTGLAIEEVPTETLDLQNLGGFLRVQYQVIEELLSLSATGRVDNHNIYGTQLSARAAAVSQPMRGLTFKLVYASGFTPPSPLLLSAEPYRVGDIIGNPDLDPQYSHEVGFQAIIAPVSYLSVSSDVSYDYLKDVAEFQQQGVNRIARNLSEVRSIAWNTEVRARYEQYLQSYAAFELIEAKRERGDFGYVSQLLGDSNPVYPDWTVRAGAMGFLFDQHLQGGLQVVVVGPRQASDENAIAAAEKYELSPYADLRAIVSLAQLELLPMRPSTLSVVGSNLLNTQGPLPGFSGVDYPMRGRTVFANWRQDF